MDLSACKCTAWMLTSNHERYYKLSGVFYLFSLSNGAALPKFSPQARPVMWRLKSFVVKLSWLSVVRCIVTKRLRVQAIGDP